MIYCLVPRELAGSLHDPLRRHFAARGDVEVVIERRRNERRLTDERRAADRGAAAERRRVRAASGRRVAERRAPLVRLASAETPALPRRARRHADEIVFVERVEQSGEALEDAEIARLVTCIQAGDRELFADLYMRYFDRVYGYLRALLNSADEAEDAVQQVFTQTLEALPRYERREQPFRSWLFAIARNAALRRLRVNGRVTVTEPAMLGARQERALSEEGPRDLEWLSDPDLMLFVERLPLPQRQVLALRFMLDMSHRQVAEALGKTEEDVRALQHRALRFLRARLAAVGRSPRQGERTPMRRCPDKANVLRARRFALML
jgi:RNA polymerase sigma-70 factor (ECF subfamily)